MVEAARTAVDRARLSPEDAGLDADRVDDLVARAAREVEAGTIGSCQLAIARHGRLGAVVAIGEAGHGGGLRPSTTGTLYVAFSCTKAIVSAATWLLVQEGLLDPAERVATIVPEFAANGKEAVTVEHLLCHTAGFPAAPFPPEEWPDRTARLARFARWRLEWPPGSRYTYHPTSSMWVLAEVLERRAGVEHRRLVRERVAGPLGLVDLHLGAPPAVHARIADVEYRGSEPTAAEREAAGYPELPADPVLAESSMLGMNQPFAREVGIPGGGAVTNAASLVLFYQALLQDGRAPDGMPIWRADVLADALRVRTGDLLDPWFGVPANRALGVVIAGDETTRAVRGFGRTSSPAAFGHNGAGGQIAWGDPATGISFAFLTSTFDRNPIRVGRRGLALSSRAAACAR